MDYKSFKSEAQFASVIGVNQVTFNRQIKGGSQLKFELVYAILTTFNDVSAEWLIRGEGEMLKSEQQPLAQVNVGSVIGNNNVAGNTGTTTVDNAAEHLNDIIQEQQKMIADLQKTINKLVEKL